MSEYGQNLTLKWIVLTKIKGFQCCTLNWFAIYIIRTYVVVNIPMPTAYCYDGVGQNKITTKMTA